MTIDVKLGLVVGLGVVLAVAVTYYPKAGRKGGPGPAVPALPTPARASASPTDPRPTAPPYYGPSGGGNPR
jgi:hypothetical protein